MYTLWYHQINSLRISQRKNWLKRWKMCELSKMRRYIWCCDLQLFHKILKEKGLVNVVIKATYQKKGLLSVGPYCDADYHRVRACYPGGCGLLETTWSWVSRMRTGCVRLQRQRSDPGWWDCLERMTSVWCVPLRRGSGGGRNWPRWLSPDADADGAGGELASILEADSVPKVLGLQTVISDAETVS